MAIIGPFERRNKASIKWDLTVGKRPKPVRKPPLLGPSAISNCESIVRSSGDLRHGLTRGTANVSLADTFPKATVGVRRFFALRFFAKF